MNMFFNRAEASPSVPYYQDFKSSSQLEGIVHYNKFVSFFLRRFSKISLLNLKDKTVNTGSVTRYICERYLNLKNPEKNSDIWNKVKTTVEKTGKEAKEKSLDVFVATVVEALATEQEIKPEKETETRNLAQIVKDALDIESKDSLEEATKIKNCLENANKQPNILRPQDSLIQRVQNRVLVLELVEKLNNMKKEFEILFPEKLKDYIPTQEDSKNIDILQNYLDLTKRFNNITNDPSSQATSTAKNQLDTMKTAIINALLNNCKYDGISSEDVTETLDTLESALKNEQLQILPKTNAKNNDDLEVSKKEEPVTIESLTKTLTDSLERFKSNRTFLSLNTALKAIEDLLEKTPQSEEKDTFTKNLKIIHEFCTKALNSTEAHKAIDNSKKLKAALQTIIPTFKDAGSMLLLQARLNSTLHTLTTLQADQIKQGLFTLDKDYLGTSEAQRSPTDEDAQKLTTMLKDFTGAVVNQKLDDGSIANLDILRDFFNPAKEGLIQSTTRYLVSFIVTPPQLPTEATYKALEDAISTFKQKYQK